MPPILAIMNHKGGVGKTTTTLNMACALGASGQRVLVIDMDPQGNAATGLGLDPRTLEKGTLDLIMGDAPLGDLSLPTAFDNVSLVPATFQLSALSTVSADNEDPEYWLRDALSDAAESYDAILIDCPPSFGMLSLNALIAAQRVIVPVQCESFAIAGLQQMERTIADIQREADHDLTFRILLTQNDTSQNLHDVVRQEIKAHFGDAVFQTSIPLEPKIAEGAFLGKPIIAHAPNSAGAKAYRSACGEWLAWLDDNRHPLSYYLSSLPKPDKTESPATQDTALPSQETHWEQPDPSQSDPEPKSPPVNDFKLGLRNGVILALALTLGMALAFLGM